MERTRSVNAIIAEQTQEERKDMNIKAKCVNIDDVKVEMTFTATLREWHHIAAHLEAIPYYAPISDIKSTINSVLKSASQTFKADASLIEG